MGDRSDRGLRDRHVELHTFSREPVDRRAGIARAAVASQMVRPDGIERHEDDVSDTREAVGRPPVAGRGQEEARRHESANGKPSAYRARRAAARRAFHSARRRFFAAIQSGRSCVGYAFRGFASGRGIDGSHAPRPWRTPSRIG